MYLPLNKASTRSTWRRSHSGISTSDYLIAATALELGMELATLNVRHYPMFPGLVQPFPPSFLAGN